MPTLHATKIFTPLRGTLYSADKKTLAASSKLYKASTNAGLIYEDKKDLFAQVFSIYTGVEQSKIRKKLNSNSYVFLSYNLTSKQAQIIKPLSKKLYELNVFKTKRSKKGLIYQGIEVRESGEKRIYMYEKSMTPLIGYVQKMKKDNFIHANGIKGVENFYNEYLTSVKAGEMSGRRDINSFIIFNRDSKLSPQVDGRDIVLNISLVFQEKVEQILSKYREEFNAQEVIAAIMDSKTGKVITLASSNRFNPSSIKVKDYQSLNLSAVEQTFEPGSVMKPIIVAKLLEEKLIKMSDIINGYNGRFKIQNKIITDEHKQQWFSVTSALVQSSNIAMAQLGLKLQSKDLHKYLKTIGLGGVSGVDLSHERQGAMPTIHQLDSDIYKATISYGYGVSMNFMQLLKIYSMFSNDGKMVTPRIVDYMVDNKKPLFVKTQEKQTISPESASKIKQALIQTTLKGTTRNTYIEGLEIGAKTGTAQISENGKYVKKYISSVFGFANDKSSSYTIGVTTFLPEGKYFASQTSAKVFRELTETMIEHNYLQVAKKDL